jgi:hypothetical protein
MKSELQLFLTCIYFLGILASDVMFSHGKTDTWVGESMLLSGGHFAPILRYDLLLYLHE